MNFTNVSDMAAFSWTLAGSESSKQRGKVRIFLWTTRFLLIGVACGTASKWVLFGTGAKVDGLGVALDLKKWMKKIFSLMKHFFICKNWVQNVFWKKWVQIFLGEKWVFIFYSENKIGENIKKWLKFVPLRPKRAKQGLFVGESGQKWTF